MIEGRLERIKEELVELETSPRYDTNDFSNDLFTTTVLAGELVEEVEELRARQEAVCAIVSDAVAFGEALSALKILEAVRG